MEKPSSKNEKKQANMRKFKVGDDVRLSSFIATQKGIRGSVNFKIIDFKDGLYSIKEHHPFRDSDVTYSVPHYILSYASEIKETNIINKINKHNESNSKKISFYGEVVPSDKLGKFEWVRQQLVRENGENCVKTETIIFYYNTDHFFDFDGMLILKNPIFGDEYVYENYVGIDLPTWLLHKYVLKYNFDNGNAEYCYVYTKNNPNVQPIPFITKSNEPFEYQFLNEETAIENGFSYRKNTEFFFHNSVRNVSKYVINNYVAFRNYSNKSYKNTTTLISAGLNYTFGVEIETNTGMVPAFRAQHLNVSCVRDGSCGQGGSGEYVTGVLRGDEGFFELKRICDVVGFNCTVDNTCGLHVHIGSVKFTKEFNIAMYKIGLMLQDEIFSMFPLSRLKTRNRYYIDGHGSNAGRTYGSSCGKLPDLGIFKNVKNLRSLPKESLRIETLQMYTKLYSWLSTNSPNEIKTLGKKTSVLSPHQNRYPLARYVWLNMIPTNFSKNGSKDSLTVEFRNHPGTINYFKIKNWILICMAIVNYAENNAYSIIERESITLEEVLKYSYRNRKLDSLLEYIEKKKTMYNVSDPSINAEIEDREYASDTVIQNEKLTKKQLILD